MLAVTVTESAQDYLAGLLEKQPEGMHVRMFVTNPGTPQAETCLSYCKPEEVLEDDAKLEFDAFEMFFENRSLTFLEDAMVDFSTDKFGGQLTIKAPNSRTPRVSDDSPLEDKVNYILWNDINPSLASHGGEVKLTALEDDVAVLTFGGGCQGCAQLDVTLKDGVEKTLLEKLPELKGVRDSTDHSDRSNAYY